MSKLFYKYDPVTHEYLGSFEAQIDPVASKDAIVYVRVPNTTDKQPPQTFQPYRVVIFNPETNSWSITPDYRGEIVYNKTTKEAVKWNLIGIIPSDFTLKPLDDVFGTYQAWNEIINDWAISEEGRKALLDDIWEMRKQIRERECTSDLQYKEHWIHVDAVSFNDIMLAAQEAMVSGDMETTKRWVTADNVDVQLNGYDFIAIAKAYGLRRQQLVYSSNEAWQQDLTKTNEELMELYIELRNNLVNETESKEEPEEEVVDSDDEPQEEMEVE